MNALCMPKEIQAFVRLALQYKSKVEQQNMPNYI